MLQQRRQLLRLATRHVSQLGGVQVQNRLSSALSTRSPSGVMLAVTIRRLSRHFQGGIMGRSRTWLLAALAAAAIGCSGDSTGTSDNGGNNGGGGGGAVGAVTVGDIFFKSAHNGTSNPAQDTVAVGQTVTWTWGAGATTHSVESLGPPSFTSSDNMTGAGQVYTFTFTQPGTYHYQCAIHGPLMTGTIVVQ
jgi:plastocyanin